MPTKKWFEENPKVTAYISQDLHQKLEEYMEQKGHKKVSQAITAILEEKLLGKDKTRDNDLRKEVEQLRTKVDQHEQFMFKVISGGLRSLTPSVTAGTISDKRYNQLSIVGDAESADEIPESKPPVTQTKVIVQSKPERPAEISSEWMTLREAYDTYGNTISYEHFRKLKPQQFKDKFGIEADPSRKKGIRGKSKNPDRWLRKLPQADQDRP